MSEEENKAAAAEGGAQAPATPGQAAASAPSAVGNAPQVGPNRDKGSLYWVIGIVALVCLELYFYGKNGSIRVCVAKEGVHDWNLIGQMRTDANRWKFPYCEERQNLGLRSEFDDVARDAVKSACRRGTLMQFQKEYDACIAMDKNWRRRVITRQVMPWEKPFYRRLFWLDRN